MAAQPDEQPISIALNGVRRIVLSCSPHEIDTLALGHLVAEGWIRDAAEIRALEVTGPFVVSAELDDARVAAMDALRRHQTLHGCGLRHALDCDTTALAPVPPTPAPAEPAPLLRALFAAVDERAPHGGMHGMALSDGTTLLAVAIDVARHCAVDRVIGAGLRQRHDLAGLGFVSTARISGAIALKVARARLGWIVSRSVATSLARDVATAAGMHLLERAGRTPARP